MNLFLPAFIAGAPGAGELALLFVVILLLFGPKRLPEIARMIGRTFDEMRRASQEFRDQLMGMGEFPDERPAYTKGQENAIDVDGSYTAPNGVGDAVDADAEDDEGTDELVG